MHLPLRLAEASIRHGEPHSLPSANAGGPVAQSEEGPWHGCPPALVRVERSHARVRGSQRALPERFRSVRHAPATCAASTLPSLPIPVPAANVE